MARLRVLFAPDSFKGSLSSVAVAQAMAEGWARARPDDELLLAPLADGGDGRIDAVAAAAPAGLVRHRVTVADPIGRPIEADYLTLGDGSRAIVELAAASGLGRLAPNELDAGRASTDGTGALLLDATEKDARRIVLGLGGSATTDGGSGILRRLGARLSDADGAELPPGGAALARITAVDLSGLPPALGAVAIVVASDVNNGLLGPNGAAAVFGPQKGATPALVTKLDSALARWVALLERVSGRSIRDVPATGAAGGTLAGLLAIEDRLEGLEVRSGVEVVMELTGFGERLAVSDLVVTGEGRLDAQTALGKTVWGVAQRARAAGVRCVAVVGSVGSGGLEATKELLATVVATGDGPTSIQAAMAAGAAPIAEASESLARTLELP
jgi:glycerate kinase